MAIMRYANFGVKVTTHILETSDFKGLVKIQLDSYYKVSSGMTMQVFGSEDSVSIWETN